LTGPIPLQRLQSVSRGNAKVVQSPRDLQLAKLPTDHLFDGLEPPDALTRGDGLGVAVAERDDHR
jgi:hypothetical protein